MADISTYISTINTAIRGEDVRDAILECLKVLSSSESTAYTLNGHPASFFATQSDMDRILPMDEEPLEGSTRPVSSGGLYTYLTKLIEIIDGINGESV